MPISDYSNQVPLAIKLGNRIIPRDQILQFGELAPGRLAIQLKECQEIVITEEQYLQLTHYFDIYNLETN